MSTFITSIGILKYIGLLGIPVIFSNDIIWKYFALFWLFGIVEFILTIPVYIQAFHQVFAIPYLCIKYCFKFPDAKSHPSKVHYSLPFKEKWTVINGGVDKDSSHSWNIYSQRYAYDFVILNKDGNSSYGNKKNRDNYYCYKKDILAPADGTVVALKRNHRDSKVFSLGRTDHCITDLRGNYIIIKHAEHEYSCLAHLLPYSLKVKIGQFVKRGEIIAQCGNSGNSTEPHLHFQVQDSKSFFYSMSIPINFREINVVTAHNYANYDNRPISDKNYQSYSFIHRGLAVSNFR